MNSMTGFGLGTAESAAVAVRVELSAVNRRNLDVHVSLPRPYAALESRCQAAVQQALHRGRIQVRVEIRNVEAAGGVMFHADRAAQILAAANAFAAEKGLAPIAEVRDLLRVAVVAAAEEESSDLEKVSACLDEAIAEALRKLQEMRAAEGAHLAERLREQLAALREVTAQIEPLIEPAREEKVEKLRQAVAALSGDLEAAQPRLLQEIALYGERTDIREETDRIHGHLDQVEEKLGQTEPVGRALDFLCQELAREFNTLSVKAARADINHLALQGKERVEMFREQVQNLE